MNGVWLLERLSEGNLDVSAAVSFIPASAVSVRLKMALVIPQELLSYLSYLSYSVLLVPVPFFVLLHASMTGGTVRSLLQSLVAEWRRENRARAEVSAETATVVEPTTMGI